MPVFVMSVPDITAFVTLITAGAAIIISGVAFLLNWQRRKSKFEKDTPDWWLLFGDLEKRVRKLQDVIVDLKLDLELLHIHRLKSETGTNKDPVGANLLTPRILDRQLIDSESVTKRRMSKIGERASQGGAYLDILKLLKENVKGMSTMEIRDIVGLSREHVSRTMGKLFAKKLVERRMDVRPFIYVITSEGLAVLGSELL